MTNVSFQALSSMEVIGVLPAGGTARRISPLPLSKELFPLGFEALPSQSQDVLLHSEQPTSSSLRPKVVSQYLLERMQRAGICKAFMVLRPGKWDIPAYFGDGARLGLRLAYLTVHREDGVPYTLDQAYPFVESAIVALGFPDIIFQPVDAYATVLHRLRTQNADVVLGLFPTEQAYKAGMVNFDADGRVRQIIEKPKQSSLRYMWAIAVWAPRFTQFMHEFLANRVISTASPELPIGDVIQAAIAAGLRVEAEPFSNGSYLDVGTPDDLIRAIHLTTPSVEPIDKH